jgi:hypothetical protein
VAQGGTIKLQVTYRDQNGTLIDPDSSAANVSVIDPTGATALVSTAMTKASIGVYFAYFSPVSPTNPIGAYLASFTATVSTKPDLRTSVFYVTAPSNR